MDLRNYCYKIEVDDIDSELFTLIINTYTKTDFDTQLPDCTTITYLQDNYMTSISITETLMNNYATITLLGDSFYNKTEIGNMLLSYSTVSYFGYNFYTKTETGTFLADKLINIGDIELPGWLGIGTSGYTNSRIRCNAEVSGYTGYAEMRAATITRCFKSPNIKSRWCLDVF